MKFKDTVSSALAVMACLPAVSWVIQVAHTLNFSTAGRLPAHSVFLERNEDPIIPDAGNVVLDIWEQSVGLLRHWHAPSEGTNHRGLAGVKGDCVFPLAASSSHADPACERLGKSNKGMYPCGGREPFRSPSCVLGNRAVRLHRVCASSRLLPITAPESRHSKDVPKRPGI